MAWTYQQLFNTLTDGDLNGQDSWSGSLLFDVTTSGTPYEGAKHVSSVLEADSEVTIERSISPVTEGTVYVSIKVNKTGGNFRRGNIYLYQGAVLLGRVFFFIDSTNNGKIQILSGASWVDVATISNNTYYRVGIQWDDVNQPDKYRANVNNGTWTAWSNWVSNGSLTTGINKIALSDMGNNGNGTGTIYFDTISPDYTPTEGATGNFFQLF